MDVKKIEEGVRLILEGIGENPDREGLIETPERVARMYGELTAGYGEDAQEHLKKSFEVDGGGMVIEKDIPFSSTCEHHLMPFFGKVHVAYVKGGKVAGLSKLARTVDVYARRLQLQERLNEQIADALYKGLNSRGVLVAIEAEHTCMTARGVKKIGSKTFTYTVRGEMKSDEISRVFALIGKSEGV